MKPDSAQNANTAGDYTNFKKRNAIQAEKNCVPLSNSVSNCSGNMLSSCETTQDEETFTSVAQSKFINILKSKCIDNDLFYVATNNSNTPFGSSV